MYETPSRQLKNDREKKFPRFARYIHIGATHLYTLPSAVDGRVQFCRTKPKLLPPALIQALHTVDQFCQIYLTKLVHCMKSLGHTRLVCLAPTTLQFQILAAVVLASDHRKLSLLGLNPGVHRMSLFCILHV